MKWLWNKIKQGVLKLFDKIDNPMRSLKRYFLFILQVVVCVILLYFITIAFAASFVAVFGKNVQLSDLVLFITAAFILAYTYETKKLKDETILQRKMSAANDIHFRMNTSYRDDMMDKRPFGFLETTEALSNVSRFTFLKAIPMRGIGNCTPFVRMHRNPSLLEASYFIKTGAERNTFLEALQLQDGNIKAWVLMTDGTEFVYTFRALGDGWKQTLDSAPNLGDQFILVKKELYEA
jgi:hypothetical protein